MFPTTRWTIIRQAATPASHAKTALEELCTNYSGPVLAFFRRRMTSPEAAEDLTQEFFTKLVSGDLLERADPGFGRFRSFLLKAARDFLADAHDRTQAAKRGGGVVHLAIDAAGLSEPATNQSPEDEFEALWGRRVLQRAFDRLQADYADGRAELFDVLKSSLDATDKLSTREASSRLMMSESAVRVALHRMRQRLGVLIREEVAETVSDGSDIDDELLRLRRALEHKR